jgi:hypothetical protein
VIEVTFSSVSSGSFSLGGGVVTALQFASLPPGLFTMSESSAIYNNGGLLRYASVTKIVFPPPDAAALTASEKAPPNIESDLLSYPVAVQVRPSGDVMKNLSSCDVLFQAANTFGPFRYVSGLPKMPEGPPPIFRKTFVSGALVQVRPSEDTRNSVLAKLGFE